MKRIYIGKIVSTHGVKGELKIISNFQFKEKVFCVGKKIIIDDIEYKIMSYRKHKQYDMITLDNYRNINEVLFLLNKKVYMMEEEIAFGDLVLDEELLDYSCLTVDGKCGIIKEIFYSAPNYKIMRVKFDREILIPFNSPMIKEISKKRKEVIVEIIEGM